MQSPVSRSSAQPSFARRHELGSPSARSLLLTVLGEFLLPAQDADPGSASSPAWTSAFIEALGLLDVEPKSARQALARTAADGWISSARHGRRVAWQLTQTGHRLLSAGAERIYGFAAAAADWDGRWLLVLVSVPETDRRRRHLLRNRLGWAGLGSPSPGLWCSPYPHRQAEVQDILDQAGVGQTASSFVGRDGEIGDPLRMVRQAWDVVALERGYEEFCDTFCGLAPETGEAMLRAQIRLVHEWRRFPLLDPALPVELLPADWSGLRAAALFRRRHEQWSEPARRHWRQLAGAVP